MLKQRVITAVVLLAVLLPALFWPTPWPFAVLMLLAIAAGGWEFARLNGCSDAGSVSLGLLCVACCAAAWGAGWLERPLPLLWLAAGAAWVLAGGALLRAGVRGWPGVPRAVRLAGGLAALCVAWLAVVQARVTGINFLLSVLLLVWVADIAAYFAGRAFGLKFTRNKLAPAISPGKSWEGVWGGVAGVLALAFAWVAADAHWQVQVPSLYSRLAAVGAWFLVPAAIFLVAMSVVGDLAESLVKRSAGAKDSSGLLPGHGGVLDRVDALLPTLPLAMMLATWARP
ncbi:phosphatidate cytidylyltransferase [Ramlibacter sp.]|uniref:phosphatidate cytidylyltransferase n=1 Tax=Ramlibacter sp. TaxID=1917967 RepID=UPI002D3FC052|nr:phosphatidate cytidylyltransferase [Ramlibacter sp.]HYD78009.1 phosphatidate cytidylyltransferase [Ramlibacter sp.]